MALDGGLIAAGNGKSAAEGNKEPLFRPDQSALVTSADWITDDFRARASLKMSLAPLETPRSSGPSIGDPSRPQPFHPQLPSWSIRRIPLELCVKDPGRINCAFKHTHARTHARVKIISVKS